MIRRHILIGLLATTALAGCNTPVTDKTVAAVASDISIIAAGLQGVIGPLSAVVNIDPTTLATAKMAINGIADIAKAMSSVTDVAGTQPLVQKLETYLNMAVSALATVPLLPPTITIALQAASILLPVIESLVGLAMQAPRAGNAMSPAEARLVLKASAIKR
jgi:hypothetical protein